MKKHLKLICLISLILTVSLNSFAEDAIYLVKDKPAPFSGYLLPDDKAKNLYNAILERDSFQTQLDLERQNSELKDKKVELLLNQNQKLMEAGTKDHELNTWERIGWFTLGIVATGLAIKGAASLKP